jgi:hypothetical protein
VRPHSHIQPPGPCLLTIVFVAIAGFTAPRATEAAELGVEARGGFGFGSMLSQWQRDQGYQSGFVPDLRPGLRLDSSIAAELAFQSWFFPRSNGGTGRATLFGAGGRWDPRLRSWLTWFLDGHAGIALTGPVNRFMFDVGTGFDIWIARHLAVGPFLRYAQVVGKGVDPQFWAGGIGVTMTWASSDELSAMDRAERQRTWERERQSPARRDRDHDGVADEADICPDEPVGSRPDPNMLGCPRQEQRPAKRLAARAIPADVDADGVPDREDQCPDRPFGKYPDPLSLGCPLPDRDHDGVPDALDACPNKRGQPSPKERRNGCASGASLPQARPVPAHGSEPQA